MGKFYAKPYFYVPVALVVIVAVFIGIQFMPNSMTPARLHSVTGDVQADMGNGYVTAPEGLELSEDDKLKTGSDGKAVLVLYEGVILQLKPDTEITISELSKRNQEITQSTGSVWSKITKLGGVESYSIQTPTTTATVRGTNFKTEEVQRLFELLVAEGTVQADGSGQTHMVSVREKLIGKDGLYVKEGLSEEDLAEIREVLQVELETLRDLRLREVFKNTAAVAFAKSTWGATDEDIAQFFLDIDAGKQSEDAIREAAPAITPSMELVFAYDAEIKKTLEAIVAYS